MNKKLALFIRNLFIILLMVVITFSGYVAIATRNVKEMTIRQRVLKAVYPVFTWLGRISGKSKIFKNEHPSTPPQSFYELTFIKNNGDSVSMSVYKGKKILIVNTASDCGYTDQYDELQKLYDRNKERLVIIGFPANDFKQQEQKTDEEIATFCQLNYSVSFPLAKKSTVIPGHEQNPVFQWLTHKEKNGWTNKKPSWNFSKYLVNEQGILVSYFDPSISPIGKEVTEAINK